MNIFLFLVWEKKILMEIPVLKWKKYVECSYVAMYKINQKMSMDNKAI